MFERKHQPVIPHHAFVRRLFRNIVIGLTIVVISLLLGIAGYSHFEEMNFVDAFVNAAMILSGMGPVSNLKTDGGKIFAGLYALFSGIVFLIVIAIIFAPLIHRFFHKFLVKDKT